MQFSLILVSILSVASAAVISERSHSPVSGRATGELVARANVCGGLQGPFCCQTDAQGAVESNCVNGTFNLLPPLIPSPLALRSKGVVRIESVSLNSD